MLNPDVVTFLSYWCVAFVSAFGSALLAVRCTARCYRRLMPAVFMKALVELVADGSIKIADRNTRGAE